MTSTVQNVEGSIEIGKFYVEAEEQDFHDWNVKFKQSHILHSQCSTPVVCKKEGTTEKCQFCIFCDTLDLPHLPDMVFPNNILTLTHKCGASIEFKALDALKTVQNQPLSIKVSSAQIWQESRSEQNLEEKIKPFDWTYSTDYKGTFSDHFSFEDTDERIDLERLKQKEKILFYQDFTLYEDELHDNGVASCNIKIRVMPSSFFILLRYFLRIDNIMVRVNDTRIFHDFSTDYILREFTNKESPVKDLDLPMQMFIEPNLIAQHLPLVSSKYEKITWTYSSPSSSN